MSLPSDPVNRRLSDVPVVMTLTLGRATTAADGAGTSSPVTLSFAELFTVGGPTFALSPAALLLRGRRVRLVGFVAQIASVPRAFYLCPRPVAFHRGGTARLPRLAVRVTVPDAAKRLLSTVRGPVEVVGLLDVGYREEPTGEASWIRLTADRTAHTDD